MDPWRCTVIDGTDPAGAVDLAVHAPPGATLVDAVDAMAGAAGFGAPVSLLADGRVLAPGAVLGLPPLVEGAVLVALPGPETANDVVSAAPTAPLHACVVAGPDAGHVVPLAAGRHTIGRAEHAAIGLDDASLSRRHAAITVAADGLTVHDLGSTNGSTVDGVPVPAAGAALRPGQRLRLGATTIVVRLLDAPPAAARPDGRGHVVVNRSPRQQATAPDVVVRRPPAPEPPPAARPPWVAIVVPMLLCVPLAWLTRQPSYLAFGLLGPVTAGAGAVGDRLGRRRTSRRAHQRWRSDDEAASRRLEVALAAELAHQRRCSGDAAELLHAATRPARHLWERGRDDPGLLEVTLGSARRTAGTRVEAADSQPAHLADAPVTLRLDQVGHLALTGDRTRRTALARYLLAQLCVRASPNALQVVVVGDREVWSWTRWLPHRLDVGLDELDAEVRRRSDGAGQREVPIVVLLDGVDEPDGRASQRALSAISASGAAVGVHLVCADDDLSSLPGTCGAVVAVAGSGPSSLSLPQQALVDDLAADGVGAGWAEQVARALAPLREAAAAGVQALPAAVGLPSLLALYDLTAAELARRWRRVPRSTVATLGAGPEGPATIDLVADGPHALVAGTTGSGKSELLQTLVTSLALVNRPDELSFVLVDYKGGAAFQGCTALPHVLGVVTDLDDHLAARALTSLQAELTRRERVLSAAGVPDVAAYQRLIDSGAVTTRLPRLVLVIDEFRVLANELPEFVDGLVRLAAVGRSLGVHLVLATQRPAGVVTADIKANVNLRICLRVRDRADSHDVLDAADAAAIPAHLPGRALLRTGGGPLQTVQVALASGVPHDREPDRVVVTRADQPLEAGPARDELAAVAGTVRAAAERLGAAPPPSPWLPPLPDVVPLQLLPAQQSEAIPLGLVDRPRHGRQGVLSWCPRSGSHLAVCGASRTGRTTTLLAVVAGLAERGLPCHLHAVDAAGGALSRVLTPLPVVGTVVPGDQPRRVGDLVRRLTAQHRTGGDGHPTVLLVDGWDALVGELDRVDHGQGLDDLLALVRDGESSGLRLVVTGGRALLLSRLASLVGERLMLRSTDPTDLLLAGAPAGVGLRHQPPGRAVHLPSGHEVQIGWPGTPDELAGPTGAPWWDPPGTLVRLRDLPPRLTVADLGPPPAHDGSTAVTIGAGGDDASALRLWLADVPLLAVAGPPGSGRSTTLLTVASQLHEAGLPVAVLTPAASPLDVGPWARLPADNPQSVAELFAHSPATHLLVDDADLLQHSEMESLLLQLSQSAAGAPLVVATTTTYLAGSVTGVAAAVRRARAGVLLQPGSPHDGEPFGVRAEPPDVRLPGRGLLVVRGTATPVQVALPPRTA